MRSTNIVPGLIKVPNRFGGPEYAHLTLTYDFQERIGAGGFGEVWRTLTRGTGDWHQGATRVSFDPLESDRVQLAYEGARAVAAQQPHPHQWTIGIADSCFGRMWVTGELAAGNLAGLSDGATRLPQLLQFLRDAASGLDGLHRRGLVHNRVKPSSILIVDGRARIGDFDLVHRLKWGPESGWVVQYGDRAFLAPEVLAGRLCPASDQFSLACTYANLRLRRPVAFRGPPQRDPDLAPLPTREQAVLARALAADPDRRFPTCQAFTAALIPD